MNRFVFIIPFRNVAPFISDCANSLLRQKYKNWIAIFCDDESTDKTTDRIPNDKRFSIIKRPHRLTALMNIHNAIIDSNLNDDDIICTLDGDDYLTRPDALDILNDLYTDDTLLTYGQYIWPGGQIGHCKAYTKDIYNNLRKHGHWASQLRTFKYKLYKEMLVQDPDLNCFKDKNGEYYKMTQDIAIITPLLEIAGFDRIKFNPTPIYYYRIYEQNDHFVDINLQRKIADEIFTKSSFKINKNL